MALVDGSLKGLAIVAFVATVGLADGGQGSSKRGRSQSFASSADHARDVLLKSMQRTFSVNVVAIIVQRDPGANGTYQRVKVERSADGKIRHTFLQPLQMQGMESVDDGDRCRVYLPDQKLLIDQDSPAKYPCDLDRRMGFASQNYSFQIKGRSTVAGRSAVCVVATPRNREMESRRFYLDAETSYPLRMEAINSVGGQRIYFDTKDIRYPKSLASGLFKVQPAAGIRTVKYRRPRSVDPSGSAKLIGFTPVMPASLPLGFHVLETQINETPEWRALAMRITDGLVHATVYQWKPNARNPSIRAMQGSSSMDRNGLRFLIVSELSPALREKLLFGFAARAEVPASWPSGRSPVVPGPSLGRVPPLELLPKGSALQLSQGDPRGLGTSVCDLIDSERLITRPR